MIFRSDMNDRRSRLRAWLLNVPRYHKRAVLMLIDFTALSFILWLAFSLRLSVPYMPAKPVTLVLMIAAPVICIITLWWFDVYKVVTRYMSVRGATQVTMAVGLGTLVWSLLVFMAGQEGVPRSVILPFWVGGTALLTFVRYAIRLILESVHIPIRSRFAGPLRPTVIYGAGQLGARFCADIRKARDREIVGFIDSSPSLWRQYVNGVKVHAPARLPRLIERESVSEVVVAIANRRDRKEVLRELEPLPVKVKILPAYEDFAFGRVGVSELRDVEVGDLLGRDPVKPSEILMARAIHGKAVLVTGAGGSIGSELARQIVGQSPRLIVLLDISEAALYAVELEIRDRLAMWPESQTKRRPVVKAILGSVLDQKLVRNILVENEVETVYHAAAYKHVPIVECNPIVGLDNNLFGTYAMAKAAQACGVERFVLVSTDKAVRPANIMGASKRLAEMVLQGLSAQPGSKTIFAMVRFGNVLDSSGSVVPRFREQIRKGGPITVTHPDVTRYFMSLSEAAELVIQAGAMASGGEVFVLQMGDPVRIDDLARLMVRLSNLEVCDENNPNGDIAISYIGLRPGEKLYEELLIGAQTQSTEHPRIFKSDEPFLSTVDLEQELLELQRAMAAGNLAAVEAALGRTVESYLPSSGKPAVAEREDIGQVVDWTEPNPRTLH